MNLKTTIVLALLVGAGAGGWIWLDQRKPTEAVASPTLEYLQSKLAADKITRIEVTRWHKPPDQVQNAVRICGLLVAPAGLGPLVASYLELPNEPQTLFVLERKGKDWALPGNWPVRTQETEQWLATLASLRSRFTPIVLGDHIDLKPYGLGEAPLTIKVTTGDESHTLRFGEEPDDTNRFTRSTFMRLDNQAEVIQFGPGVFGTLDRKAEYFQQRRLFPVERVAKDDTAKEKVDQLAATAVQVETKDAKFTVAKKGKDWIIQDVDKKEDKKWKRIASEDRIDPARRDAFLRAFPDLWADKFVHDKSKSLQDCGLKEPEFILSVTKTNGTRITLVIGKVSSSSQRLEMKGGPPGTPPRMVKEDFRYAKLDKNDQLFEIKADKLDDITVPIAELRDPRLARFKTDDVKRLEIKHGDQDVVLVKVKESDKEKAKEKWQFEKAKLDADGKTVEELLDKLSGMQARDKDIHDDLDPKTVGLDKPRARIKITLEEADKDAKKDANDKEAKKKTRDIVFQLGIKEKETDKTYVRVDSWPRVNEVPGDIWKLATRSDLAYRPRDLWHIDRDAITKITVQADGSAYDLKRADNGWKISSPFDADLPGKETEALAEELTNLTAEKFDANNVKDLAKFGLNKPAFKISIATKDGKSHVLEIGKQVPEAGGGRYARLGAGDSVFILTQKLVAQLRKDPYDLLDKNLLTLDPAAIQRVRFQGGMSAFTLQAKAGGWQVLDAPAAPFTVADETVKAALGSWRLLHADKIVAIGGKIDWARFGLDKPTATITVTMKTADAGKTKEHVIEFGKEADKGSRYVRIDKKDIVGIFDANSVEDLQPRDLDFIDPRVLKFDGDAVTAIERKMPGADLELTRREDNWLITKPGVRDADILTVIDVLRKTSTLRVKRIAAYPAKDLQTYGLDKPVAVVTLLLENVGASKHVIKVGNLTKDNAKGDTDERFALIDDRPMVVVLPADLSRQLLAPVLFYADRNLAAFSNVDRAEVTRGTRKAVFSRTDTGWKMVQPVEALADELALDDLIRSMQRLRADEIVADKSADLKKFGLDQPFLQWRFKSGDAEQLHLIVGNAENDQLVARRYAKIGNRQQVFLLSSKVTAKVQSECRERRPWLAFAPPTKITVVHKGKTLVLQDEASTWKVAGDPGKKVDAKLVDDTVAALASLKALHYVADAKADLKQYGLADPTWKITLDVAKGTRELWLGGYEDKSKRFYATVPSSGAVFVIDESTAARITRSLDAYLVSEKKK